MYFKKKLQSNRGTHQNQTLSQSSPVELSQRLKKYNPK